MKPDPTEKKTESADESTEARPKVDPKKLDLSALDLTVDKVEERISPSETNVFDK